MSLGLAWCGERMCRQKRRALKIAKSFYWQNQLKDVKHVTAASTWRWKLCYPLLGKYETQCEPAICSEELLSVTNQAGGTVKGKYFDNWYVICTSEQCKPISRQICVTTQRTRNLFWKRSRTEKEKEEKVRKQRYTMTFPTKEEVNINLLSGLKLLTCHPMAKSQAAIPKISWKATPVQRPVIVCQMSTPYITRFT